MNFCRDADNDMINVTEKDYASRSVRFLVDKEFMENLREVGSVATPRRYSHEETTGNDDEMDMSESLFDGLPDRPSISSQETPMMHINVMKTLKRLTVDRKVKAKELLKERPTPHEEYKIYKDYDKSPDSLKFLLKLLSEHLCMKVLDLHTMLWKTEGSVFLLQGEECKGDSHGLSLFKNVYFNKKESAYNR